MKTKFFGTLVAILLMAGSAAVFAGGPLLIFDPATRTPYAYAPGVVPVYTDLGNNGVLSGAVSDANTASGFAEWTNVPSAYFAAAVAGDFASVGLPDITGANAAAVVGTFNGGGIHVMYDNDGTITSNFFGAPPGVLGIASPDFAVAGTSELTESWAMINGSAADPGDAAGIAYAGVFTHEFGHSINLAHTQTVGAAGFFGDQIGPDACGTPYAGPLSLDDFETMYPFLDITPGSTGEFQATVDHADDIAALSTIYPAGGFPGSHGSIIGIVYGTDGVTQLTGINVIARPVGNPFKGAVSALSGDYTQGSLGPDGRFALNGLVPGQDYVVYIDEIVAGGFSTTPNQIPGDGNEEYWNAAENVDPGIDDPCDFTLITPAAGAPFTADIIVNGDPNDLDLGDDDYIELALPFAFPFCGQNFSSVFVNSNGSASFGSPDTDFSETIGEFLNGPARIAPLWDDFNPTAGGTITAGPDGADFVISWNNVPEWPSSGSNSFALRLRADGSFDVTYGTVTATDGLAGRTPGLGSADPGEIDLSAAVQPIGALAPTVYEEFLGDGDLDNELLAYAPCAYPDPAEIEVDPTSLSAVLRPGESITQVLTVKNLGELDLDWTIASSQGAGAPATGGVIPRFDGSTDGDDVVLNEAQIAKVNEDIAAGSAKAPHNPLKVYLPHAYALSLLNEDFNGGFPAGWSAIDNEGNGVNWTVPAQGGGNYTGASGDACGASSDFVGPADFDCELRTPAITGFGPNVVLSFVVNYQNFGFLDYFDVDVSTDGGSNWTNVLQWNEDHPPGGLFSSPGEAVALNLDPVVAGASEFIVRFHYYDPNSGDYDWYVQIDDVVIVSDETLTPCGFVSSIAPDAGTTPGGAMTPVDVTFDATGYAPGTYDCELIIDSNAFNEPRLVVPLQLIVAHDAALDIKPGSCPNPFNLHLFDFLDDGKARKGGVLPVALAGKADFDVADVDLSTIRLEGVMPSSQGGGPKYADVATAYDNSGCDCTTAGGDGIMDINMKFLGQDIAAAIVSGPHRTTATLRMTGYMNDGTMFIAEDCITFVGNYADGPPPIPAQDGLGAASPNPFNPTTRISYSVAHDGPVNLSVFDVKGRLITRLVNGTRAPGEYSVMWQADGLPSGIYFYRLETSTISETRKLVLLK